MRCTAWLPICGVVSCFCLHAFAKAQIGGVSSSLNPPGSINSRGAIRGLGGLRGRSVNPNLNPPGSLSAIERFTPRGSMNPAYNLNPQGSAFRPPSGAKSEARLPSRGGPTRRPATRSMTAQKPSARSEPKYGNGEEMVLLNVRLLERELRGYENGGDWVKALRLSEIHKIFQDRNAKTLSGNQREILAAISARFQQLNSDHRYDAVTQLRGFAALAERLATLPSNRTAENLPPAVTP